ncbi:lytic transglycosylase domain-containing protein [Citrobacter meridianamericanus]|uniref:lytic transglycosylase domain-containing protein n=1 Tax=Citrobacter meridianamericanus TaxID=2894201 RepID=UPI0039C04B66
MLEFLALAEQCAPTVAPQTMAALVHVESSFNPYAIGVVGGRLARQPTSRDEAVATAKALEADGWNFSVGVAQVNRYNLPKYNLTYELAFDACANLRAGSKILEDCFVRATPRTGSEQAALQAAFSCYYSGNFTRGFRPDKAGEPSYVQKVLAQANVAAKPIPVVPSIKPGQGGAARPKAVKAADSAPATDAPAPVAAEPADHAPVLLRPSSERDAVRLQRAVPGTDGNQPAKASETAGTGGEAKSSVVVF